MVIFTGLLINQIGPYIGFENPLSLSVLLPVFDVIILSTLVAAFFKNRWNEITLLGCYKKDESHITLENFVKFDDNQFKGKKFVKKFLNYLEIIIIVIITIFLIATIYLSLVPNNPYLLLVISFTIAGTTFYALFSMGIISNPRGNYLQEKLGTNYRTHLLICILIPIIGVLGVFIINQLNIGWLNYLLLLIIPIYAIIITYHDDLISSRLYPLVLFSMGLGLLLMYTLRSDYIVFGADTDWEYYLFYLTQINQHWANYTNITYDSCISISILPTVYLKFLKVNPEYLFRLLYPLLFSISPLIVYSISRKYLEAKYAFLGAFFFISFYQFFSINNRVDIALIFFSLIIFTLFTNKLKAIHQKMFIIIFFASCVLSHYSTAFISFFLLTLSFIVFSILEYFKIGNNDMDGANKLTITLLLLFFSIIFLWNSFILQAPFNDLVIFLVKGLNTMKDLFLFEASGSVIKFATGSAYLGIPGRIEFILSWSIIALTLVGIIATLFYRLRKKDDIPPFNNVETQFIVIAGLGYLLLILTFANPFISVNYSILRTFFQMLFFLNVFFILGVFYLMNIFQRLSKTKLSSRNTVILLLIIIVPYFMCTTGTLYQLFDVDRSITLNSDGKEYEDIFIHQTEIYSAKWLKKFRLTNQTIQTDYLGRMRVIIGGQTIPPYLTLVDNNLEKNLTSNYIYLRYYNVIDKNVLTLEKGSVLRLPMEIYDYKFQERSLIYTNGASQIWI